MIINQQKQMPLTSASTHPIISLVTSKRIPSPLEGLTLYLESAFLKFILKHLQLYHNDRDREKYSTYNADRANKRRCVNHTYKKKNNQQHAAYLTDLGKSPELRA